jgi:hypothetical protein
MLLVQPTSEKQYHKHKVAIWKEDIPRFYPGIRNNRQNQLILLLLLLNQYDLNF